MNLDKSGSGFRDYLHLDPDFWKSLNMGPDLKNLNLGPVLAKFESGSFLSSDPVPFLNSGSDLNH